MVAETVLNKKGARREYRMVGKMQTRDNYWKHGEVKTLILNNWRRLFTHPSGKDEDIGSEKSYLLAEHR